MHIDLPTNREIERLLATSADACVSIYLPTTPQTDDTEIERISWKNSVSEALEGLRARGLEPRRVQEFEELFEDLDADDGYWYHQARTLAVFSDGRNLHSFQLPNELSGVVKVSDRFFVKPLLRSVTFPQACFVLALAAGSVRLLELGADYGPYDVTLADLPTDVASAVDRIRIADRAPTGGGHGETDSKIRIRQYARAVDRAVRSFVRGHDLPVLLAATEPIGSIYREVNTAVELADRGLEGSPEKVDDLQLAAEARTVLDRIYADDLEALSELFGLRNGQGRVATDVSDLARLATYGQIDTLVVDIDEIVWGTVDDDGAVTFSDGEGTDGGSDVVDEIVRRTLAADGRVVAVRSEDVFGEGAAAAILRWA